MGQLASAMAERDLPAMARLFSPHCRQSCRGFVPLVQSKGGGYEAANWVPRLPGDDLPLLLDLTRILASFAPDLRVSFTPLKMRVFEKRVLMRTRLRLEGSDAEGYRRVDEGLVDLDLVRGPSGRWRVQRFVPAGVNTLRMEPDLALRQLPLHRSHLPRAPLRRRSLVSPGQHGVTPWAVLDGDGDGRLDLATARGGQVVLLRGTGRGFDAPRPIFRQTGVRCLRAVDINGDGRTDLFAGSYLTPSSIWLQQNEGRFARLEVALEGHVTDAAPGDFNGDGHVDLYVVRHGEPGGWPVAAGERDLLVAGGQPVTVAPIGAPGWGLAVCAGDLNGDGALDLFVANGLEASRLLINRGGGQFEDQGEAAGLRPALVTACSLGDVDNDGRLDLLLGSRQARQSYLFGRPGVGAPGDGLLGSHRDVLARMGDGVWLNRTRGGAPAFVHRPLHDVGWTTWTGAVDHDSDGRLDLLLLRRQPRQAVVEDRWWWEVLGPALRERRPTPLWGTLAPGRSRLWVNLGPGGSRCCRWVDGGTVADLRPAATALLQDLDGDGGPELLLAGGASPLLLRWPAAEREAGHGALLRLHGRGPNRHAVGSRVTLHAEGKVQVREVGLSASGLPGGAPGYVHFGVGEAIRVERVEVRWPDGTTQRFLDLPVDRQVTLVQGGHASWGDQQTDRPPEDKPPPSSQPASRPVKAGWRPPARPLELTVIGDAGPVPLHRFAAKDRTVLLLLGAGDSKAVCRRLGRLVRGVKGVKVVAVSMSTGRLECGLTTVVGAPETARAFRGALALMPLLVVVNADGGVARLVGSVDALSDDQLKVMLGF